MRLRALLSQICAVAVLLMAAAMPSMALAHPGHEHGATHATIADSAPHAGMPAHAFASAGASEALSQTPVVPDMPYDCACQGACCCAGCTMVLAEDVPQIAPLIFAGARIQPPAGFGGPETVPEALPEPPKSLA
jgi:hypothetical protein